MLRTASSTDPLTRARDLLHSMPTIKRQPRPVIRAQLSSATELLAQLKALANRSPIRAVAGNANDEASVLVDQLEATISKLKSIVER